MVYFKIYCCKLSILFLSSTVASPPIHPTDQSAQPANSDIQASNSAELKLTLAKYIQSKRKSSPELDTAQPTRKKAKN